MANTQTRPRPRRSVELTTPVYRAFKEKVSGFATKYDAALFFGFSQVTLDNILLRKSGKESTVNTIIEKLGLAA